MDKCVIVRGFESTLRMAKLRALSKASLERKLTDSEFGEFRELAREELGV